MKQANRGAGICQRCLKHWKQVHPSKRVIKPVEKKVKPSKGTVHKQLIAEPNSSRVGHLSITFEEDRLDITTVFKLRTIALWIANDVAENKKD